jgi:hypothetical protein
VTGQNFQQRRWNDINRIAAGMMLAMPLLPAPSAVQLLALVGLGLASAQQMPPNHTVVDVVAL